MSANAALQAQDCCAPCTSPVVENVPGPQGAAGTNGTNGTNGVDSFTTTTAAYTQPAVAALVSVAVVTSAWAVIGQVVYVQNGGYYTVDSIPDATHLSLKNLGYTGNAAPAVVIGGGQKVGPGGLKGTDGVAVGVTLNSISPTQQRGDIVVDDGTNAPAASVVRYPVGTDGQIDTADSTQPTGHQWKSVHPNASGTTDNQLARYDTPAGTEKPAPIQTSSIKLTDNGALQHTGGNAKGTDAVDIQPSRALATQVASGNNSFLAGKSSTASGATAIAIGDTNVASGTNSSSIGSNNAASGINSTAVGVGSTASNTNATALGHSATASGADSIAIGTLAVASGQFSFSIANDSQATAQYAATVGGTLNAASGSASGIFGGLQAVADKYGQFARASGAFANPGDAQISELIWRVTTTDATAGVEMFLDGIGASKRASIPVGSSWVFQILLIGRSSAGVDAAWKAEGCIHNNGGTTALVGGAITAVVIADGTGGTWGVAGALAVTADNANDTLKLAVTGAVATTIRWVASARITEVSYP